MKVPKEVIIGAQPHQLEAVYRNIAFLNGRVVTPYAEIKKNKAEEMGSNKENTPFNPKLCRQPTFINVLKNQSQQNS